MPKSLKLIEVLAAMQIRDTKAFIRKTYVCKHVYDSQAVLESFYIKRENRVVIDLKLITIVLSRAL